MTIATSRSRLGFRVALAVVLTLTAVVPAAAQRPASLEDVTATPVGRALVTEATERFRRAGVATRSDDLRVYELGPGDHLIGPADTVVHVERTDRGEVSEITTSEPMTTADAPTLATSDIILAAAPYWGLVGSYCWARTTKTGGWMDTCYHKHKLYSDGSSTTDWFELHVFGTAKSTYPYRLFDAYVHASPNGGATQSWHDWDPGADLNLSCQTITIGVVAQNVAIAYNHNACDKWDITKYSAAGTFRTTWRAGLTPPVASERQAAFTIASKVANGGTAQWKFSWNFTAACC